MSIGDYVIAALMMATFGVLIAGVVLMGTGGKANAKYSNRLMVMRVSLQALVLIMLALLYAAGKH